MASRTDRVIFVLKLLGVTARAGRMRRKSRFRRFFVALVTEQTRHGFMPLAVMIEFGKINVFHRIGRDHFFGQRLKRAFGFRFFLNRART